ncbi:3-oxoacyl-ACP synthase [Streptomyces avermitilis]|uniref:Beta-ketoacyl-[acyl-carrier-protein] synthase III n=2 Tax=Streptomyces avermitilis TaxID=33903 RepID=Q82KT2_STRAW|nr:MULTISPECIES: beta-ketoacyl-ACP synthase III [Streptomyces]KUN50945.1 3-oxoacyl-ACP synthase [Streptomyces avermitilis]MYS97900.1 beta-ketoacyl-ACP synthase III [Streptomyces sp. SID5469]OOV24291.1 ketoacyl-ACP synthase III [Streptomyces avermitilis]BAC70001.1 putative 3-oxoacyl-ACP synthase III [Streptomyces avermitilis MA-4680 = NBRC 14893]GDY62085.1 3-oxoacyl-[acyl-carrier-protein] synthase 3 protein 3 [Streptomyces avermitilis]
MSGGRAAVITGIGGYVPPDLVTNDDLAQRLDTSDAWIRSRTGIAERHVIAPGTATSDLAVEAGLRALKSAGDEHVDAVVLATTTPDQPCPATAPQVAARLGLGQVPAFDVAAVCSGFLFGLATASGLIAAGVADKVLLVAADAFTTIINPEDRTTAVIFADGAGAVVLRAGAADEPGAVGPLVLGSDGELSHLIEVPAGGSRQRSSGPTTDPDDQYFRMLGRDTYRHAVERMTDASQRAAELADWRIDDVDRFAAHQANARILDSVAERLGVPAERQLTNIARVGNTGAASIPLLLSQAAAAGRLGAGHRVLLTAFGGGLSWGAGTLVWPEVQPV